MVLNALRKMIPHRCPCRKMSQKTLEFLLHAQRTLINFLNLLSPGCLHPPLANLWMLYDIHAYVCMYIYIIFINLIGTCVPYLLQGEQGISYLLILPVPSSHALPTSPALSDNSNLVIADWRRGRKKKKEAGRVLGGLSLFQLFIFIPLFSPSQEGLSSSLLILLIQ